MTQRLTLDRLAPLTAAEKLQHVLALCTAKDATQPAMLNLLKTALANWNGTTKKWK